MHKKVLAGLVGLFVLGLLALARPAEQVAAAGSPVVLQFTKSDPDGNYVWNGKVSGGISGKLKTRLLDAQQSGEVLYVVFEWKVDANDPRKSFVATLQGTLNLATGVAIMDGTVTEGYLLGAQVHEEGRLVVARSSRFKGTIEITP